MQQVLQTIIKFSISIMFVYLFVVTEATQFCVHGGLQQIKGSLANPLSKINVTTSYENEAKFTLVTLGVVVSLGQSTS